MASQWPVFRRPEVAGFGRPMTNCDGGGPHSGQQFTDDAVGQDSGNPLVVEAEPLVVAAKLVKHHGVKITDVGHVA